MEDERQPQGAQERQILTLFPRWRLGCKAVVSNLEDDAEMSIKVTLRSTRPRSCSDPTDETVVACRSEPHC